jgi:hypothetical protein
MQELAQARLHYVSLVIWLMDHGGIRGSAASGFSAFLLERTVHPDIAITLDNSFPLLTCIG